MQDPTLPRYSDLFSCRYDQPAPVGKMGRGTHYSVFRTAEWHDVNGVAVRRAQLHDFAVIWDEDHDTRVIPAIENLYVAGLLAPVQFIGERKGTLTVLVAACFYDLDDVLEPYRKCIAQIAEALPDDRWEVEIGSFCRSALEEHRLMPAGIIADTEERVAVYLRGIDHLWKLGTWPIHADQVRAGSGAGLPSPPPPPPYFAPSRI